MKINERELKQIIKAELMKEGFSDALGFYADKAKRAIFGKKESSLQFRNGSGRVLPILISELNKVLPKMNKVAEKSNSVNLQHRVTALGWNGRTIEISDIKELISNNVATWSLTLTDSNISFRFSCIYGDPKPGINQKYVVEYKQSAIEDRKGNKLSKEKINEEAVNEKDAVSLINMISKRMNEHLDIQLRNLVTIKEPVLDKEKEKREKEEIDRQRKERDRQDYEKRIRDFESEPKVRQFDPEFKLPI